MRQISTLELRQNVKLILERIQQGESLVLTYRGVPVARLEPLHDRNGGDDDPIYHLGEMASEEAEPLTNDDIDKLIYGP